MIAVEPLKKVLENSFPEAEIHLNSSDGVHFTLIIVDDAFEGLSRLQRERRVTQSVQNWIQDGSLHALSIRAKTRLEWANEYYEG